MNRYGLIGQSLEHSFSPAFFEAKFQHEGIIDCSYESVELEDLENVRERMHDFAGFNVTIPYKSLILPFLDELSEAAQQIGAVNCVRIMDGRWIGFNTDAEGFENDLRSKADVNPADSAIILGSGGASKAVQYALKKLGIDYTMVSRSGAINYGNLSPSQVREARWIINTTPLGMFPEIGEYPDIPYEALTANHMVYDLVYNPEETVFMRKARLAGAQAYNGMGMLIQQAELSWQLWQADHPGT